MSRRSPPPGTLTRRSSIGLASILVGGWACHSRADQALRIWAHHGQPSEHDALKHVVEQFNARTPSVPPAELTFFPDSQYSERLAVAAAAGDLPHVFELDGPRVAEFAAAGLLRALDDVYSEAEVSDFLPTILKQGTIGGRLYALGAFDSAAVVYFDRELFARAGVSGPDLQAGFTWDELLSACERLKTFGVSPIALHMNESADEWFTYAFSPLIWSGGGALIAPDGSGVRGVLASAQNRSSLTHWQRLFIAEYAEPNPIEPDPFGRGQTAMDWSGHWMLRAHARTKQARLGIMSLPRMGAIRAEACGSWCWAISANTPLVERSVSWLRWITRSATGINPVVRANGAIPARRSAIESSPGYEGGPERFMVDQLLGGGHPRPRTPFYGTLSRYFAAALRDIAHAHDVGECLARAEQAVARVIERRRGQG